MNDWLGASWMFLWATEFAFIPCLALAAYAVYQGSSLRIVIYGSTVLENFCFLYGSALFVAGSYPEEFPPEEELEKPKKDLEHAQAEDSEQGSPDNPHLDYSYYSSSNSNTQNISYVNNTAYTGYGYGNSNNASAALDGGNYSYGHYNSAGNNSTSGNYSQQYGNSSYSSYNR